MHSSKIDEIDRRILIHLQRDARASLVELSESAYLSPPQCYRRIKRLEQDGVIKRCVALLNREKMGLGVLASVGLTRDKNHPQGMRGFDASLRQFPEILECYTVTGTFDYLLKVVAKDLEEFNVFLNEKLLRIPGVASSQSTICLEEIKFSTAFPIDLQKVKGEVKPKRRLGREAAKDVARGRRKRVNSVHLAPGDSGFYSVSRANEEHK